MNANSNLPSLEGDIILELPDSKRIQLSVQEYQAIFNQITGRSEKITKGYSQAFDINFDEISQLHKKIIQVLQSYEVVAMNYSIIFYHKGEEKIEVSSLDKYDIRINEPIESILFSYKVSIKPTNISMPKFNQPQNYTISVRFVSELALNEDIVNFRKKLPYFMTTFSDIESARFNIEYVDYTIAQNIKNVIGQCIAGFKTLDNMKITSVAIERYRVIQIAIKYIIFITSLISLFYFSPGYLQGDPGFIGISKLSLWYFIFLFFSYKVGNFLSFLAISALHSLKNHSQIFINRGDEKLIEKSRKERKRAVLKFFGTIITNLIISIASSVASAIILK